MKMKTKLILSLIAAMLLQFTTIKADTYTDGLMKMMNSEILASLNAKSFQAAAQIPGANANYLNTDFKKDAVEWMAPHYRKYMSEKEFNEMLDFYMQPEMLAIQKKVLASASGDNQAMMQQLMPQVQSLMMGGTADDLSMPDCDPKLKEAILHWLEINKCVECSKAALEGARKVMTKIVPGNMPADQMEMMNTMMDRLFTFMEKNMTALTLTMMVNGNVELKDIEALNAIEKKSFFANYQKTAVSVANDMSTFVDMVYGNLMK